MWRAPWSRMIIDPSHELGEHIASPKRLDYVARDSILKLLSDAELAQVSSAEGATELAATDEYIDLEQLEHGVRKPPVQGTAASRMLPRSAVSEKTWAKIVAVLGVMKV